jgi:predicted metal-dependent HD superfamily phosphohydrolase
LDLAISNIYKLLANLDMKLKYMPHTPRLKTVDRYIRVFFRDEMPDGFKYHDADHTLHPTKGVVASANRIAISENISEHDRELLITAAYFHDAGYIRKYKKNEPIAARMAGRILKLIGYKPNEIVKVQKMILSTDLENEPESHVEKILCDADLDHFGREDFLKLDGRLREEWREKGMDVNDDVKWYKDTLELLKKHQFYTESQKKLREKGKQKNIKSLIKKMENIEKRYEAKYNPVLLFQRPQL